MFNRFTTKRTVLNKGVRLSFTDLFFTVLFLAVFLGDGKQAFVDVFLSAGLLLVFAAASRDGRPKRQLPGPPLVLWTVLILYLVAMTVFSFTPWLSVYQLIRWVAGFLVFRMFFNRTDTASSVRFLAGIRVFAVLVALLSLVATAAPFIRNALPPINLLYSSFGHNHSVDVLFFALPAAFWLWITKRNPVRYAELGILVFGVLFSLSRAGIVLTAAVFYFGAVVVSLKTKSLKLAPLLLLGVAVAVAAWLIISTEKGSLPHTLPSGTPKAPLLIDARREYWRQAFAAFGDRPLFGFGPGSFSILSGMYQKSPGGSVWYSHNFMLATLAETGLTGFFLWAVLTVYIFVSSIRRGLKSPGGNRGIPILLVAGTGATLLLANVDFVFEHYVVWLLYWASLGVALGATNAVSESRQRTTGEQAVASAGQAILTVFYILAFSGIALGVAGASLHLTLKVVPFNTTVSQMALIEGQKQKTVPDSTLTAVSIFHGNNPDVQLELAKYYESTGDEEKSVAVFSHTISLSPKTMAYHEEYVRHLFRSFRYSDVAAWLNLYVRLFLPAEKTGSEDPPTAPPETVSRNEPAFLGLFDDYFNTEVRSARLFYLMGIDLIESSPGHAQKYWGLANRLMPDLSYLYIERASLTQYAFHQSDEALRILAECSERPPAAGDCQRYSAATLPLPGSQINNFFTHLEVRPRTQRL